MQINWKTNVFRSLTTLSWTTTPAWCWGTGLLFRNQLPHHSSLNSHFVNEWSARLPNNDLQFTLGYLGNAHIPDPFGDIFSNPQSYLKTVKLLTGNHGSKSIPNWLYRTRCFGLAYATSPAHGGGLCKGARFPVSGFSERISSWSSGVLLEKPTLPQGTRGRAGAAPWDQGLSSWVLPWQHTADKRLHAGKHGVALAVTFWNSLPRGIKQSTYFGREAWSFSERIKP